MVRLIGKKSRKRGFTLVELLVVVAIIGVLSSIGIPSFKRMVQKAKKTEAKTALGALYTAEQSFFSEYGSYGNNILSLGYQTDSSNQGTSYYSVGFPGATCITQTTVWPLATDNPAGTTINLAFPGYFGATVQAGPFSKTTSNTWDGYSTVCLTTSPGYTLQDGTTVGAGGNNINLLTYTPGVGTAVGSLANYATGNNIAANAYIAQASGVIQSAPRNTADTSLYDQWTIDHQRTLRNTQDGVK